MSNPFAAYAGQAIPKTVQRRDARREKTAQEKAQDERDYLSKQYRAWRRQWRKEMIERGGPEVERICRFLKRATADDGDAIVEAAKACTGLDATLRHFVLTEIDAACQRIRANAGLHMIDDPLPGERETVWTECREILR